MQLFGSSGIRALADWGLVQLAVKVGMAVGGQYGRVVVGSDTRTSGPAVKHALVAGLLGAGAEVYDAGILPTPTLALAGSDFSAATMITASHNPPQYNGIKLLNPDGSAFDANQRRSIEDRIAADSFTAVSWERFSIDQVYPGAVKRHIERIMRDFPTLVDLKVVLDCGGGAASVITPYLLNRLGCRVTALNCCPTGFFPHEVEPTEANLSELARATRELGANIGIAHDGDADRMMVIDERGRFVPGDKLLAIFARDMHARKVVTTVDASLACTELDYEVVKTRVGDIYVSEELKRTGDFGGEPSGAWIFPSISLCPDGIYAAARIASIAGRHRISRLVDELPSYPLVRGSTSSQGLIMSVLEQQLMTMNPVSTSRVDGIKLDFTNGWVLVRPSGTEPKVRITAEARSEDEAHRLYQQTEAVINRSRREQ